MGGHPGMKFFRSQRSTNSASANSQDREMTASSTARQVGTASARIAKAVEELVRNATVLPLDELRPEEQDALIAVRFPFRYLRGIVDAAVSPRKATLGVEGRDVSAFIDGESVYLGVLSGEGAEAEFESVVSFAAWVKAVLHVSGSVLRDLVTLRPRLAAQVVNATQSQLAGALRQSAFIILRRLSEHDHRPPTHWFRVVNHALSIESDEADEGDFCALWRQWRRDGGIDGEPHGPADEPLFAAALIENALAVTAGFHLKPELLPVDTLRDWYAGGGSGIANGDLEPGFMLEWADQLSIAWATVPVVALSYGICAG